MIGIILVAMVLGALVGVIAQAKGRGFFGRWIYGTLLFVVAIIHVLVIRPNATGVEARALVGGDTRKCPHCAEIIKAEAKVCRYCGRDVMPTRAADGSRSEPAADYLG
jgi:hypothetical protein